MNFRDQGIIISKKPLKERSSIITVFTEEHGIYSGVLNQYNKKTGDNLVEGNLIDFFWSARLHEHIGSVKAELIKSYNSHIIMDKTKLYAFNSIVSLLKMSFCEREEHNNLFPILMHFVESFKHSFSFEKYINLELEILAESGYKLQLDHCAVTNSSDDLYYVSPKSGRAVSKKAGDSYADKLLKLPSFLLSDARANKQEAHYALRLTSYFLERYIFINNPPPGARKNFIEYFLSLSQ
ncbi:MAG: DNA repair protein RecO [Rickettsiaceae bacterium]|nr:DNA repair protein RecO [Rickettsiaceae bacterium]